MGVGNDKSDPRKQRQRDLLLICLVMISPADSCPTALT